MTLPDPDLGGPPAPLRSEIKYCTDPRCCPPVETASPPPHGQKCEEIMHEVFDELCRETADAIGRAPAGNVVVTDTRPPFDDVSAVLFPAFELECPHGVKYYVTPGIELQKWLTTLNKEDIERLGELSIPPGGDFDGSI